MRTLSRWIAPVAAALMILGGVLIGRPGVAAAAEAAQRTISVTGTGVVVAQYDTAVITLGVSALKPTPVEAYQAMALDISKVAAAMKAQGLDDKAFKTGNFSLYAEYDWVEKEGQVLRGYRATNTLAITTNDLDKVAELIQIAVNSGANQLQGVNFSVKDVDAVMDQALDKAVDDARATAERVAKRLGANLGPAVQVNVSSRGSNPVMPLMRMDAVAEAKAPAPAPVFSGTAEVTATVNVTFELQ